MSLALRRYCLYPIMLTKVDGVPSERALQFASHIIFLLREEQIMLVKWHGTKGMRDINLLYQLKF